MKQRKSKLWRTFSQMNLGVGKFVYSLRASGWLQTVFTLALTAGVLVFCLWLAVNFIEFVLWLVGLGVQTIALGVSNAIALTFGIEVGLHQVYGGVLLWLTALLAVSFSIRLMRLAWFPYRPTPRSVVFRPIAPMVGRDEHEEN